MYDQHDVGEIVTLTATYVRQSTEAKTNPAAIALTITAPDGTSVVKAIGDLTNPATGDFSYNLLVSQEGMWSHRWVSSGNGVDSDRTEFFLAGASARGSGPCDLWISPDDVFKLAPASRVAAADRDWLAATQAAEVASRMLFVLSKRKYPGICRTVLRPCRSGSCWGSPALWRSSWGVCSCGADTWRSCGCGAYPALELGVGTILAVESVWVDGVELARSAYRVDNRRALVRLDGQEWPSCQDLLNDPHSETDTFEVTVFHGAVPPADGVLAAERLAADVYASMKGLECAIPASVQNLARQGVSMNFQAAVEGLDKDALVGLKECDRFLRTERYGDANLPTLVASPDVMPASRQVGT